MADLNELITRLSFKVDKQSQEAAFDSLRNFADSVKNVFDGIKPDIDTSNKAVEDIGASFDGVKPSMDASSESVSQFVDSTKDSFESVKPSISSTTEAVSNVGTNMATSLNAVAIAAQVAMKAAKSFYETFQRGAELNRAAKDLNLTATEFQGYKEAATQAGVSNTQFSTSIRRVNQLIGNAKNNIGSARDVFAEFGIIIDEFSEESTTDVIAQLSDAFAQLPTDADRASASIQLFGRGQERFARFLSKGSQELAAQQELIQKSSNFFSDEEAERSEQAVARAEAAMRRLSQSADKLKVAFLPIFEVLISGFEALTDVVVGTVNAIGSFIDKAKTKPDQLSDPLGLFAPDDMWEYRTSPRSVIVNNNYSVDLDVNGQADGKTLEDGVQRGLSDHSNMMRNMILDIVNNNPKEE